MAITCESIRPGDVVVLQFDAELQDKECEDIRARWSDLLGERAKDHPLIILSRETNLTILHAEEQPPSR